MLIYLGITYSSQLGLKLLTHGDWGKEGLKLIKDIGKKLKEAIGEPRTTFFLTQRISTTLHRGNASCVLGTVPFTNGLVELGLDS